MSRANWVRVYHGALDDYELYKLSGAEFYAAFVGAINGEQTPWSKWIKPGFDRPLAREWAKLRTQVFQRDNFTCQYCGERGGRLECDHVVPVSRGGEHELENLKTACFSCNRSKRDKLVEEWLA